MRSVSILMLLALAPFAVIALPAASRPLLIPVCSGDGAVRLLRMRLPTPHHPGDDEDRRSCLNACHADGSRKRVTRRA